MSTHYTATVAPGQQLYISNLKGQTQLSIAISSAGQQQQQAASFATGEWQSPPALYCAASGIVLQICGQQEETWVELQGQQMRRIAAPAVAEVDRVELQPTDVSAELSPLPPLKPGEMKMGSMEMHMQPMRMKMGDMEMGTADDREPPSTSRSPNFCSQCGQPVRSGDRYCAQCGHSLTS